MTWIIVRLQKESVTDRGVDRSRIFTANLRAPLWVDGQCWIVQPCRSLLLDWLQKYSWMRRRNSILDAVVSAGCCLLLTCPSTTALLSLKKSHSDGHRLLKSWRMLARPPVQRSPLRRHEIGIARKREPCLCRCENSRNPRNEFAWERKVSSCAFYAWSTTKGNAERCGHDICRTWGCRDKNLQSLINDRVINLTWPGQISNESNWTYVEKNLFSWEAFLQDSFFNPINRL